MKRKGLKNGRRGRRSRRLLLEEISSSFLENSLNNLVVHGYTAKIDGVAKSAKKKIPMNPMIGKREDREKKCVVEVFEEKQTKIRNQI